MISDQLQRPRVLLADDDASVRIAVSRLLLPSCDVVGYVADTATLFDTAADLRPDVIVLDFSLAGGLNGIEVCRRLTRMRPAMSVVVFTAHNDEELSCRAFEAGASAYVWKLQAATDLLPAIRAAVAGLTTGS